MGITEIIIIIVAVLFVVSFIIIGFANSKKIKRDAIASKEAVKKPEKTETIIDKTKEIIKQNSIDAENYIKKSLLDDEVKPKKNDISLKEVTFQEIVETDEDVEQEGAIILGHKKNEVHILEDEFTADETSSVISTMQILNDLDEAEVGQIASHHNEFEVEDMETKIQSVKDEIKGLSKEAKAILFTGILDRHDI